MIGTSLDLERVSPDGNPCGPVRGFDEGDGSECGTILERRISDGCDRCGDDDRGKLVAVIERVSPDG